jgi:choline dehydrogenase-like flavoprotein
LPGVLAEPVDRVVLGAGPAGVGAADRPARAGHRVAVLERAPGPGGAAASFEVDGIRVDHGSHRLHPAIQPRILDDLRGLLGDELVVVVLPLAVLAVAWWVGPDPRRRALLAVAGGVGVLAHLWLVVEGAAGRVTWAVDPTATANPLSRARRLVLPDYLAMSWWTWGLHGAWLVALAIWAASAAGAGHRLAGFRRLRRRGFREA